MAAHRWDAQSAIGDPAPIEARLASDVADELVNGFIDRVLTRTKADRSHLVGDLRLHCTDTNGEWTFEAIDGQVQVISAHIKARPPSPGLRRTYHFTSTTALVTTTGAVQGHVTHSGLEAHPAVLIV